MRILAEDTFAIAIDFQERLVPVISGNDQIVERTKILLNGLNVLEIPTILTRQYPRGLGDTIDEIKSLTESCKVFDKISFSCYDDVDIKKAINNFNKKNVIICGVESHVCVLQTIIDLQQNGFQAIYVNDCAGSRFDSDKNIALHRIIQEGALVTSSEAILFELTRAAGTDKFKQISKLVK